MGEKQGKQGEMKGRGLKTMTIGQVFYKIRCMRGGRGERKGMKGEEEGMKGGLETENSGLDLQNLLPKKQCSRNANYKKAPLCCVDCKL